MRRVLLFITAIVLAVSSVSSNVSAVSGELQPGGGLQMKEINNATAGGTNGVAGTITPGVPNEGIGKTVPGSIPPIVIAGVVVVLT